MVMQENRFKYCKVKIMIIFENFPDKVSARIESGRNLKYLNVAILNV